jgi:hypothetical protein
MCPNSENPEGDKDDKQHTRGKIQVDFGAFMFNDDDDDLDGEFRPIDEGSKLAAANL